MKEIIKIYDHEYVTFKDVHVEPLMRVLKKANEIGLDGFKLREVRTSKERDNFPENNTVAEFTQYELIAD